MKYSLRSFSRRVNSRKRIFRRFLTRIEKQPPRGLDILTRRLEEEVWKETACLSCGNCCKTMTPTYTPQDIRRISAYLGMTPDAFKEKWLRKERNTGDWLNKSLPCQFFDTKTYLCSIYEVRPADCSGFPHLSKRKMSDYIHVHKQNVALCPATFNLVEKMMEALHK